MLPKGFIGKLSDYVSHKTDEDKVGLSRSLDLFNPTGCLDAGISHNQVAGLLSEWLVFDHKQEVFDGLTGIEYFVKHNPLGFSKDELSAYKELLNFEVGLFEVKDIEHGKGLTIQSLASGKTVFANDINTSSSMKPGETFWTRVAPVRGNFYLVSSSSFVMPVKFGAGIKATFSRLSKNEIDARKVASLLAKRRQGSDPSIYREEDLTEDIISYAETEKRFIMALKKCGMEKFFSIETYKEWVTNEKKHDLGFALKALYYLIPNDCDNKDAERLLDASIVFSNNIPRNSLKGKTPNEASRNINNKDKQYEVDKYSKEKYVDGLEQASKLMANGDFESCHKAFENVIKMLLRDKVPLFDSFRAYANAAVCYFNKEDPIMGREIINASLRINPIYDFGLHIKAKYVDPHNDFFAEKAIKNEGMRRYKRTAFYRYENFLNKIGVSIEHEANTITTLYKPGEGVIAKIGRNDPCYCGSGSKFKKCCGK